MSRTFSIADPADDGLDLPPGHATLSRAAMADLGASAGDVLSVRGRRRTAVRLAAPPDGLADDTLWLDEGSRENAGVAVGNRARVEPLQVPAAESVTIAPVQNLELRSGNISFGPLLEGRPVVVGDRIRAALFDGAISLAFVVADAEPEAAVLVTEGTDVRVGDESAAPARRSAAETLPYPLATFDDVGGMDGTIEALRRLVAVPLRRPELYRRLDDRAPSGVLLHGPTGVGKSLLLSALANEVGAGAVAVDPSEHLDGDGSFDAVAEEALEAAPAVVVLDDVDALAPPRDDATGRDRRRTAGVTRLLDALADVEDVVVVGATARPDDVEPSLRRGGRFERELEVGVPDREGRRDVLEGLVEGLPLADDVDLSAIAGRTHGFVGADLEALVTEAVGNAVDRLPEEALLGEGELPADVLADVAVTAADLAAAADAVTPGAMRGVSLERPGVTYDDVGGLEEAKREVIRAVEWPLRYPELFETLQSTAPKGLLLYGPPGTGKTLLARALANSTDANFIPIDGPELLNRYVGESERGVREVFDRARRNAPAIVFFDEIDALAPERGGDGDGSGVIERVVSQLLTELDGIEPREEVIVIGATNRPDMVDRALLRPGRLEKAVSVPIPDREAREEIFEIHTRELPMEGVDPAALATRTEGYTGSDIEAVVREASLLAMEEYLEGHAAEPGAADLEDLRVRRVHFERAVRTVDPSVTGDRRDYDEGLPE